MLRRLTPAQVRDAWEWMRAGLRQCSKRTKARYHPEDVLQRLWGGSAVAYAIETHEQARCLPDGTPEYPRRGFAILTEEHDPDGLVLFVWALWGKGLAPYKTRIYADLEQVAREITAVRIRMQSPRKGWERESFFAPVATLYEHEVTPC